MREKKNFAQAYFCMCNYLYIFYKLTTLINIYCLYYAFHKYISLEELVSAMNCQGIGKFHFATMIFCNSRGTFNLKKKSQSTMLNCCVFSYLSCYINHCVPILRCTTSCFCLLKPTGSLAYQDSTFEVNTVVKAMRKLKFRDNGKISTFYKGHVTPLC